MQLGLRITGWKCCLLFQWYFGRNSCDIRGWEKRIGSSFKIHIFCISLCLSEFLPVALCILGFHICEFIQLQIKNIFKKITAWKCYLLWETLEEMNLISEAGEKRTDLNRETVSLYTNLYMYIYIPVFISFLSCDQYLTPAAERRGGLFWPTVSICGGFSAWPKAVKEQQDSRETEWKKRCSSFDSQEVEWEKRSWEGGKYLLLSHVPCALLWTRIRLLTILTAPELINGWNYWIKHLIQSTFRHRRILGGILGLNHENYPSIFILYIGIF